MFVFIIVLLVLSTNIAIVLFFPYSFVSLIVLISLFLCCYFSFIYVGSFPIVFSLLFCISSSLFILVLLPFSFFIGYGTTQKVNNLLVQNGGHFDSSTEVRSPKNKNSRRSFNAEYETCYNTTYFSSKRIGLPPRKLILISFKIQSYLRNVT